jgi:nicotinamidase/pyrazinamidase
MQNDFCPGGALGVSKADTIIPRINKYMGLFIRRGLPVFLSRDWHPAQTAHFMKFGGKWPVHCIENTKGAEFHPGIKVPQHAILLYKGMDPRKDSYSVFQAEDAYHTGFPVLLKMLGIKELYVAGLATDYCVKFTALDAVKKGLKVNVLVDGLRGVDIRPHDSEKALEQMKKKGVILVNQKGHNA